MHAMTTTTTAAAVAKSAASRLLSAVDGLSWWPIAMTAATIATTTARRASSTRTTVAGPSLARRRADGAWVRRGSSSSSSWIERDGGGGGGGDLPHDDDGADDASSRHAKTTTTTTTTTVTNAEPPKPPKARPLPEAQPSAAVHAVTPAKAHQRIWLPHPSRTGPLYWSDGVVTRSLKASDDDENGGGGPPRDLPSLLDEIIVDGGGRRRGPEAADGGGRMRAKQYGVLHEDPAVDMRLLTENYTVHSLASALVDREEMLQSASRLAAAGNFHALQEYLKDCHPDVVLERRRRLRRLDLQKPLNATSLETIRKGLMRMPRRVTTAHSRRAGVVIPLIHVDGVPSVLLEKRAANLRAHPDEVCLPGGMVCEASDRTIVETCLREMKEEIGGFDFDYHHETGGSHGVSVLGILRCNWGEVHHLVGVAVTPVVCFFSQDLADADLRPNPGEVAELFTIPLESLLDRKQWVYKDDHAPIFVGGPYVIWGLTGYILERFWKDILQPFDSHAGEQHM